MDRYKRDVLPHKKVTTTRHDTARYLDWWKSHCGHLVLAEVTPAAIAEGRDTLLSEPGPRVDKRIPATVNRYLSALSHAFTVGVNEWGWLETNACRRSQNPNLYPVVLLALSTGMRQGEIMDLKWQDVDLSAGYLVLNLTKNGEHRRVHLVGPTLEALNQHARVRQLDSQLVFPGKTGKPAELRKAWVKALQVAGIEDFRFHDLRHTTASYLAINGATPGEIAEYWDKKPWPW